MIEAGADEVMVLLTLLIKYSSNTDAIDLLIKAGTDMVETLVLAARHTNQPVIYLLLERKVDIDKAIEIAVHHGRKKAEAFLLKIKKDINKVQDLSTQKAVLSLLEIENKNSLPEEEHKESSSQGSDNPGGGSGGVRSLLSSTSSLGEEEEEKEVVVSSSSKVRETSVDGAFSSNNKDAKEKQNSLESNGGEVKATETNYKIIQPISILDGYKVVLLSQEDKELADAEQKLIDMIEYKDNLSEEITLAIKGSEVEFDSECALKNENQESSMLSQLGEMVYLFFSSPLMSVDKVGMAVFPLYAPDYALPKLDMGGDSFKSSHEIF